MKAQLKDGSTVECTPQEYAELVKLGLVGTNIQPTTTAAPVEKKTVVIQQVPVPQPEPVGTPIETRRHVKWNDADRAMAKKNRSMSMNDLAVLMGNKFTPKAIRSQLYVMASKGEFSRKEIGRVHEPRSSWKDWSQYEDGLLVQVMKSGRKYKDACDMLPGRSEKAVKARLYTLVENGVVKADDVMPRGKRKDTQPRTAAPNTKKVWTVEEETLAVKLVTEFKSYTKAANIMTNRNADAIKKHIYEMVASGRVSDEVLPRGKYIGKQPGEKPVPKVLPKVTPKPEKTKGPNTESGAHKRMKFIHSRAKVLCEQNKNWSYETACKRAREEWAAAQNKFAEEKKVKKTPISQVALEDLEFPEFSSIAEYHQHFIEDMVRNMLGTGSKITMRDMFTIEHSDGGNFWGVKQWLRFLAEFMAKSARIATAFNVPNKFNITKDGGGYDVLRYGGAGL